MRTGPNIRTRQLQAIIQYLYMISVFEKTGSVAFMIHKNKNPEGGTKSRQKWDGKLDFQISKLSLSIRNAASAVEVSPNLVFSILHDDLHQKPYKFH